MSRIYDALKKLEAERARKAAEAKERAANPAGEPAEPAPANGHSTAEEGAGAPPAESPPASTAESAAKASEPDANGAHAAPANGDQHASGANGHGTTAGGNGAGATASGNGHGAANGNGHGNGSGNGARHAHGNGHGNGNGNGNGKRNGHRRGWRWLFPTNGHGNGHARPRVSLSFDLVPEVEEAYQRLGTNLLVGPGADTMPRLLGLTASRHGEGTTTTTVVFASVLVRRRGGRVAVVETNFRSPSLDAVLGIRGEVGLADLVQGRKSLAEVAQPTEIPNLFALPCGRSTLGPPALFDSSGIGAALQALREQFDFVLFDLPPANVYGDTSILAPRLDGALIVIEADRARISEVERVRRNLDRVGVRIVGSILNRKRNYIPAFLEEML